MQSVEDAFPVDGLYVPAGQEVQAKDELLRVNGLYVPTGQAVQAKLADGEVWMKVQAESKP